MSTVYMRLRFRQRPFHLIANFLVRKIKSRTFYVETRISFDATFRTTFERLRMDFDFFFFFQRRGIRSETRCLRHLFLIFLLSFSFFFLLSPSLIKAEVSLLSHRRGDTTRSFRSECPNVRINIGRLNRRPWF